MPKTYLLVGLSGSGKSTTANCIFNQSGDQKLVNDLPFYSSDNSKGTTQVFAHAGNDKFMVLDTVGKFGNDPLFVH
jgi:predicted GTPase